MVITIVLYLKNSHSVIFEKQPILANILLIKKKANYNTIFVTKF